MNDFLDKLRKSVASGEKNDLPTNASEKDFLCRLRETAPLKEKKLPALSGRRDFFNTKFRESMGGMLDFFRQKIEIVNDGKHRIERINYRELTPEKIKELSDFYVEIFRNPPYGQFLFHEDNPLHPISPQEFFGQPDKSYFSLEEMEDFPLPEGMFHWVDREKNAAFFEKKLKDASYITSIVENHSGKIVGLIFGRRTTLKEVFETEEMGNPLLYSQHYDSELLADEESFFKKMKYHCGLNPDSELFFSPCMAIHPSARGGVFFAFIKNFVESLPYEALELPFFVEIQHLGEGHDITVSLSDSEFFGVLENGHPIAFCKKFRNFSEAFLNDDKKGFIEKLLNYKKEKKLGKNHPEDHPYAEIHDLEGFGKGVFAKGNIKKGEIIAVFEGEKYEADYEMDLPKIMRDHCIQVGEREYIHAHNLLAEKINHSCKPNCGLNDSVKVIAMRDIKPGEQLTWDYRMSEDSNWEMDCKCGKPTCSGKVGNFRNMPDALKQKYFQEGFLSDWLVKKYKDILEYTAV